MFLVGILLLLFLLGFYTGVQATEHNSRLISCNFASFRPLFLFNLASLINDYAPA